MERNKGRSILTELSDYVVIDLETTGLDPKFDEIIELGAVKIQDGQIIDTFEQLIKPSFEIDEFITELTGISNDMLATAPCISEILPRFLDFVGDSVVIGHNVNFDINFIYDSCLSLLQREFGNDFLDTMRLARRLLPDLKHHRLKDLKKYYAINVEKEHRGLADCLATFELYHRLINDARSKGIDIDKTTNSIHKSSGVKASDIVASSDVTEDSIIEGKVVVFTGTLARMPRREAMQVVADKGGLNGDNVTKDTNYLVIGNAEYSCALKDGKSNKRKKAEKLISSGSDLQIISEDTFFDMIEE